MRQSSLHISQIKPLPTLSVGSVSDFDSFQLWHRSNYGNCYKTPSFEEVIKEMTGCFSGYQYDKKADCFFYLLGQYAKPPRYPGQRIDFPWKDVAKRYESMYYSFRHYGCD